jgi:soluble cytochrome b562
MKISDFRSGLGDLQAALRKWGATKQAAEVDSVKAALAEFDDLTLTELARLIKAINAKPR